MYGLYASGKMIEHSEDRPHLLRALFAAVDAQFKRPECTAVVPFREHANVYLRTGEVVTYYILPIGEKE